MNDWTSNEPKVDLLRVQENLSIFICSVNAIKLDKASWIVCLGRGQYGTGGNDGLAAARPQTSKRVDEHFLR